VVFFPLPEIAEGAGFRSCRRCQPKETAADPRLERVREAVRFMDVQAEEPPTLVEMGEHLGMSPHHLQREFKKILGITPRQYADTRRLGRLLVAATPAGVCAVKLGDSDKELKADLHDEFFAASIQRDEKILRAPVKEVLRSLKGSEPHIDLPLDVRATVFQRKVWAHLRTIPAGETMSYGEVAEAIGQPRAARAVAKACATNRVALIVPCHRVVCADGEPGGYRWGAERKQKLLKRERNRSRK
jgi:AraC family transcriptional regulator of adaptative response/methylated-DNA-[protein]-cysteine methyltransferase